MRACRRGHGARAGRTPCGSDPASRSAPARGSCAPATEWPLATTAPWPPRRLRPPPACGGSAATRPGPANPPHSWAQWRRRPGALRRPWRRRRRDFCPGLATPDGCAWAPPPPAGSLRSCCAVPPNRPSVQKAPRVRPRAAPNGLEPVALGYPPVQSERSRAQEQLRGFFWDGLALRQVSLGNLLSRQLLSPRWQSQPAGPPGQIAASRLGVTLGVIPPLRSGRPRLGAAGGATF